MRSIWSVCRREFAGFFLAPLGYVAVGMFSVLSGLGFTLSFFMYVRMSQSPGEFGYSAVPDFEEWFLSPFMVYCGLLIMFLSPLLTMRLLAEERHKGTIELLFTYPLRDRDIIFGKYLAAMGVVLVMVLAVVVDLLVIASIASVEPAVLILGLVAVILMGSAFISLGLFISATSRSQMSSAVVTFGLSLIFYVIGSAGERLPKENPAPPAWPDGLRDTVGSIYSVFRQIVGEFSIDAHAKNLAQGLFQPRDIAYYVLFTAFFLFLTFRALESRNWRA